MASTRTSEKEQALIAFVAAYRQAYPNTTLTIYGGTAEHTAALREKIDQHQPQETSRTETNP